MKTRVLVLFGGQSGEHEVSLRSAASVVYHLDKGRYDVSLVGIDKRGQWHWLPLPERRVEALKIDDHSPIVHLEKNNKGELCAVDQQRNSWGPFDVCFPVMHGPLCEDGSIQGLFELLGVAYVGSGVLGSAVGMDKEFSKRLAEAYNVPVVPYMVVHRHEWDRDPQKISLQVEKLGYPVFLKPANMGSSVGIHKVKTPADLSNKINDSFQYDEKVLIERALSVREIEFSVLQNLAHPDGCEVSVPGEIVPTHEFYSYEAKYIDAEGAKLIIPAPLSVEQTQMAKELVKKVFLALGLEGFARVDFFLDKESGQMIFNEVNTLPGFTSISMYPKLWEASGITYAELLDRLIDLALDRKKRRQSLKRDFFNA